ncbi:MAG: N-6 DNA methylase [Planctomycetota bacterium]
MRRATQVVVAKEQFFLAASSEVVDLLDRAGDKAGVSRGQAFEDFLTFLRCELAGKTMEEEYLQTVAKGYAVGVQGKRGIDLMVQAGGRLIGEMVNTDDDLLGDIFTGAITYGEKGQFFTPERVCDLMASLSVPTDPTDDIKTVCDPACGSGRMLLQVAKYQPHWEFTGQDSDHRCAQMAVINMGLRGLRGWAVWQNSLTLQVHRVYRIGLFFNETARGVVREVPVEQSPFNYPAIAQSPKTSTDERMVDREREVNRGEEPDVQKPPDSDDGPAAQLDLF